RAEAEARAEGVAVACTWPVVVPPRLASTMTPKMPSRTTMATATAPGISQGGRSSRPAPRAGGRGTPGRRAGTGAGVGVRAGAGVQTGAGAGGFVDRADSTTAAPTPSGSAGMVAPGFHTGASTGDQVSWAGEGEGTGAGGAGAEGAGGEVPNAEAGAGTGAADGAAGAAVSQLRAGGGGSGSAGLGGSTGAGAGGLV